MKSVNKTFIIVALSVLCVTLVSILYFLYQSDVGSSPDKTPNEQESDNSDTSDEDEILLISDKGDNIYIKEPKKNASIECNSKLIGTAKGSWFFEGSFPVLIFTKEGELIKSSYASATEDWMTDDYVDFEVEVNCAECEGKELEIMLNKDNPSGLEANEDRVSIDISFVDECKESTAETVTFNVYFTNTIEDPSLLDCEKVYPVSRTVPFTLAVGRASIEELLLGPTATEKASGYISQIPTDAGLNSISIVNGVAYVDFDEELDSEVGGSCRVTAIRSQIENTLLQFESVNEVVVTIDGVSEDILQP